jgi:hypothetical protein
MVPLSSCGVLHSVYLRHSLLRVLNQRSISTLSLHLALPSMLWVLMFTKK